MEIKLSALIAVALFIEALVQVIKPIYNEEAKKFSIPEIISVLSGIIIAVIGEVNLLEGLITTENIVALHILYALSGIALGRSPSFIHDLWTKIKTFDVNKATDAATSASDLATIISNILNISKITEVSTSKVSVNKETATIEENKTESKVVAETLEAEEAEAKDNTEHEEEDLEKSEVQ